MFPSLLPHPMRQEAYSVCRGATLTFPLPEPESSAAVPASTLQQAGVPGCRKYSARALCCPALPSPGRLNNQIPPIPPATQSDRLIATCFFSLHLCWVSSSLYLECPLLLPAQLSSTHPAADHRLLREACLTHTLPPNFCPFLSLNPADHCLLHPWGT